MIGTLKRPFQHKKNTILAIVFSSIAALGAIAAVRFSILSTTGSHWQKATDVATIASIDKVLDANIDPSKLDRRYILNTLQAQIVGDFTVYRFTYPETTGTDGSLYVISDNYAKQRPVQLWDNPRFSLVTDNPACLNATQHDRLYAICP
jgi:hypothetical protein